MNIRWPLWLPATKRDFVFFAVQFAALAFLLLGHFNNLPVIPAFNQMPTNPKDIYLWLLAITIANYLIILKNARNDYIAVHNALFPCAMTLVLFTAIFVWAISKNANPINFSYIASGNNFRTLLYAQVHIFVVLNVSFLFKDNSSPVKDIARELQWIRDVWRRRKSLSQLDQSQRQTLYNSLGDVLKAFKASLLKNSASFEKVQKRSMQPPISQRVEEAIKLLGNQGSEVAFQELEKNGSELNETIKAIAKYSP
jgi:hypothetical protein